jgi:hypothetical protein
MLLRRGICGIGCEFLHLFAATEGRAAGFVQLDDHLSALSAFEYS